MEGNGCKEAKSVVPKPNAWDWNRTINEVTTMTYGKMWTLLNAYIETGTIEEFKKLKETTVQ